MKKLFLIPLLLILCGCGIFQKQDRFAKDELQAQEFYLQHPEMLAKVCAQKYPVTSGLDTGKWASISDTSKLIFAPGSYFTKGFPAIGSVLPGSFGPDTIICRTDTLYGTKTITKTKTRVDTLKVKDNAAVDSLNSHYKGMGDQNAHLLQQHTDDQVIKAEDERTLTHRLWYMIGLGVLAVIFLIAFITKII